MKRMLLVVVSIQFSLFGFSQTCNSLRYQDTIFHTVDTIGNVYFGTATPFGLFAQPQDLYLDIYQPAGDTLTKRPVIVFQFGGGFTIGWRSEPDIPQFCEYFAKCGYVVVSIDYRIGLNPLDTNSTVRAFYRGVQDERSAIRFLSQRAQQYRIDTNYLILTGTSAGCFCAFANAFMTDSDRPASTFGTTLEPDDQGCMDCSGNTDLGLFIPHIKAIVNCWGAMLDTTYINSWEHTPVISFHGDQDILVPYVYGYPFSVPVFPNVYGSVPIHQRLTKMGIPNILHPLVGYSHEPELLAPQLNDTIYNYTRPWLFNLLKPVTSDITGDTVLCAGGIANYSVVNTDGSRYCWSVSGHGAIVLNTGNAITVLWQDTGMVSVSVIEENYILAVGEEKTFQTHVVPHAVSDFSFTTSVLNVSFTNLSTYAGNYQWDFGDGTFSTDTTPATKTYSNPGTYDVALIAASDLCADTFSASFVIDSCPVADISYQLTNYNGVFNSSATNTSSYFWNFGDGDSAAVNTPNVFHQYAQNGDYTVLLQVENQLGCKETDTVTVHVAVATSGVNEIDNPVSIICDGVSGCKLQVTGNARVEVFDAVGRRLYEQTITGYSLLPVNDFSSGLYFVRVSDGQNFLVRKFVKQ